jgi:hypothetical protein
VSDTKNKMMVLLVVEVNKTSTNEVEGDGWRPTPRFIAAEIQAVMGRFDAGGYSYGMVTTWNDQELSPEDFTDGAAYPSGGPISG